MIAVSLVRNGDLYVQEFIDHHFEKGVDHIVFLDNGSTDKTVEMAASYDAVTVLSAPLPFRKYKVLMKRYLVSEIGVGGWVLLLDIDEFFDYPHSDRVTLHGFVAYLNEAGYSAVLAHMLDMFGSRSLGDLEGDDRGSVRDTYRLYDLSAIRRAPYPTTYGNLLPEADVRLCFDGVRTATFGAKAFRLTKHPLILSGAGPSLVNGHQVRGASIADITAVLYHYKFTSRFKEMVEDAVTRDQYSHGYAYRRFAQALEESENLNLVRPTTRELGRTDELIEAGFLTVSGRYRTWAEHATAWE